MCRKEISKRKYSGVKLAVRAQADNPTGADYAKSNKPVTRQHYGNHKSSARKVDLLSEKRRRKGRI